MGTAQDAGDGRVVERLSTPGMATRIQILRDSAASLRGSVDIALREVEDKANRRRFRFAFEQALLHLLAANFGSAAFEAERDCPAARTARRIFPMARMSPSTDPAELRS